MGEMGRVTERPGKIKGDPFGGPKARTDKRRGGKPGNELGMTEAEVQVEMAGCQSQERREPPSEGGLRVEEVEVKFKKAGIR